jgi:hypothetical protein
METSLAKLPEELTEREKSQLKKWQGKPNSIPLSVGTSLQFYELFLNGYNCEEIAKLNEDKFDVGMILDARVRHDWDAKKITHLNSLYGGLLDKVKKTQAEGAVFLTDLLAAAHKLHGNKIKKYLQTGDIKDLGDLQIESLDAYRKILDALMALTGQNSGKANNSPRVQVVAHGDVNVTPDKSEPTASELLAQLLKDKEK